MNRVILAIFWLVLFSTSTHARLYFDPSMLESINSRPVADLSRFEQPGNQLPGIYQVDIYINGNLADTQKIRFIPLPQSVALKASASKKNVLKATVSKAAAPVVQHDNTGLMACITKVDLEAMQINTALFPAIIARPKTSCLRLGEVIPQASTTFNFQEMRLDISIPQAAMMNLPQGWIPPQRWDEGINAALLGYRFNGSTNHDREGNSSSNFLDVNSGVNLGAWRLRDNRNWSNYQGSQENSSRWRHTDTYIERAIIPLRSELTAGDTFTHGEVFDSLPFRGAKIVRDDTMYPDTQRGFAPAIKGVAYSNAKVEIRQNGNLIYETFVAPGAFDIKDLYSLSSSGELSVTVTEANGAVNHFVVPYSSLPVLQRQGHLRYGLVAGRYSNHNDRYNRPKFLEASLLWGLTHNVTLYTGIQLAQRYQATLFGAGMNLGNWGAVSADVTQADSRLNDGSRHQGQSARLLYGRSLVSTGTTFQLASYRYSSLGFHTLDETALKSMSGWRDDEESVDIHGHRLNRPYSDYFNLYNNKRTRFELTISQPLGENGSIYFTATHQTYWSNASTTRSLRSGYSSTFKSINYNLSLSYSRITDQPDADKSVFLSISVPLDAWLTSADSVSAHPSIWANFNTSHNSDGSMTHQTGLGGTALAENNLSWNVSQSGDRQEGNSGDASLDYSGTYGNANAGYSDGRDHRQLHYGLSGGMILHRDGLTLGQSLGSTNVLIAAPGANGIAVENSTGIHTDWRGYTVVPYASSYQENRVALDINQLDDHTDLDNVVANVVPTEGAVVRANFKARRGVRVLMTLIRNGQPLPFGSTVSTGDNASLVGDDGQVYLTGLPLAGTLKARWGEAADQHCIVHYRLPKEALQQPLAQAKGLCH